ncbi:MAG: hypothetical protein KDD53_08610, partial [Bdellovibrionales bacterium]|nr:hypothetical protein [Bdellovibrionales bacterium]
MHLNPELFGKPTFADDPITLDLNFSATDELESGSIEGLSPELRSEVEELIDQFRGALIDAGLFEEVGVIHSPVSGPRTIRIPDELEIKITPDSRVESSRLRNPSLSPAEQISRYVSSFPNEYKEQLLKLADQAAPMNSSCRITVCIPVAAHEEAAHIERTLACFLNQTFPFDHFEVVLLLNHPDRTRSGEIITPDKTPEIVEAFRQRHPELNIQTCYAVFEREYLTIGYIRTVLTDLVMLRHHKRGLEQDHILTRNDADTIGLDPDYLLNGFRKLEENPQADAIAGRLEGAPPELCEDPYLFVGYKLSSLLYTYLRVKYNAPQGSAGANLIFRASSYSLVGGYNPSDKVGEDVAIDLGLIRFRAKEFKPSALIYGGSASTLYTSTRRAREALKFGLSAVEQWSSDGVPFGSEDPKVRLSGPVETLDLDAVFHSAEFRPLLGKVINGTLGFYDDL